MASLFRQVMGPSFDALAPELQVFHGVSGRARFAGMVSIAGAESWLGRIVASVLGLPRHVDNGALAFELVASPDEETWRRYFPGAVLTSRLCVERHALVERVGLAALIFDTTQSGGTLTLSIRGVRLLGVPLPAFARPQVTAEETATPGRLHFNIAVRVPGIGRLVAYRGSLDVAAAKAGA